MFVSMRDSFPSLVMMARLFVGSHCLISQETLQVCHLSSQQCGDECPPLCWLLLDRGWAQPRPRPLVSWPPLLLPLSVMSGIEVSESHLSQDNSSQQ